MVISTFLSVLFDGLQAEKQDVGLSRTDSRHAAGAENVYHPLFLKFVRPYLKFTRHFTRTPKRV